MTRYYAEVGTPPGWWLGAGVADLDGARIRVGSQVSEEQLRLLVGEGKDPSTGVPLGRAYRLFAPVADRIAARVVTLDPELVGADRVGAVARIEGEEVARGVRRAVAGFDFTFSVPKSASVLWAVGDPHVRSTIEGAHHAAVADVLAFMEREVAATRMGASDGSGAVEQAEVTGLIATGFDHFDSRAGDPHLHTHVVVANKARTVIDGQWRSLDGRPLHAAVVALSELHEALFADRLSRDLGVMWESRERGRDRNPSWAIGTVPEELVAVFSSRSKDIDTATDLLIDGYVTTHGHRPTPAVVMKLRAQAALSTRPAKQVRPLAELTAGWRARAAETLGADAVQWAASAVGGPNELGCLRAGDVTPEVAAAWGGRIVAVVGEKRSMWQHWNLVAEAARQTMGWRFATTADREVAVGAIVTVAEHASLRLNPPELATSPERFRRLDGSSRFRPRHSDVYSSEALLAAEDRLLEHGRDHSGPSIPGVIVQQLTQRARAGRRLGADQAGAVVAVATSGRVLDVLVGPAGAGKTTAMRNLRAVWEAGHGARSVIGLAPSAAAAEVLSVDLGVSTENTAKWLHDQHAGTGIGTGAALRRGQLVVVDEASLAGTATLDEIVARAKVAGAKVLLVGDQAQLQAVDAGGAFGMLAADRDSPPTLTDVRRFRARWEKTASLGLRNGDAGVTDVYAAHDRIVGGDLETVTARALTGWRADVDAGRTSVLIADTSDTVRDLNTRARADRILRAAVNPSGAVPLHDGTHASAGDVVITRRNDRQLHTGRSGVRNGDRWAVLRTFPDGSLHVRRGGRRWGGTLHLPAEYVRGEVELGYAVTAHRAQGGTVDTGHAIITDRSTREAAYVAMTRGRDSNTAYVAIDDPDDNHTDPRPSKEQQDATATAVAVFTGVLARTAAEQSAHETMRREQDTAASIRVLAAEYDTIATAAQHDRWVALIARSGLTVQQAGVVIASDAFGPLTRTMRLAEANRHDLDALLPRVVGAGSLDDAADIAAVLHARLNRAISLGKQRELPRLIAGLIPEAAGPMTAEMADALTERQDLIEHRAATLATTAIQTGQAWVAALGRRPVNPQAAATWERQIQIVAAYRDLYAVTGPTPLGTSTEPTTQQHDAARAAATTSLANQLTRPLLPGHQTTVPPVQRLYGRGF